MLVKAGCSMTAMGVQDNGKVF